MNERLPFWRQPLLHFAVLGFLIFAWDALKTDAPSEESLKIVVTVPQVERMVGLWNKTWGRPPSDVELQGLIRDHIKEEIYYREAKRLGLDQNDIVIRRRMRQKMEFLSADEVENSAADEATLRAYYADNINKYQTDATYTFEQVYYKGGSDTQAKADLSRLQSGTTATDMGDVISLPNTLEAADEAKIARLFGSEFYAQITELPQNEWKGPLTSGFGLHLVRIGKVTPAQALPFERAAPKVEMDWRHDQKIAARNESFATLSAPYTIDIQRPED